MPYTIEENGLITGPEKNQCAGYIFNFSGHGAFDPTGLIRVGDLDVTKEQADRHNALLADAETKHMIEKGIGTFYLTYERPKCSPENPRWKQENAGTWSYKNYKVSNWVGTFKSPWVYARKGYSYGFVRVETHWIWFTGPDGKKWYGVNKGDKDCFTGRRMKTQK